MDRFTSMSIFVRIVQMGSFTAVANELGTTQSNISKSVARLERHLGVQLLKRTNRRVVLTEPGTAYYDRCVEVLAALDEIESNARSTQQSPTGSLRITSPLVFGERYVMPIVLSFLKMYPEVKIDLEMSDRFVDLIEEGFDLAIRVGNLADSNMIVTRIATDRRYAIAAPSYLEEFGEPASPHELPQHRCLVYSYLSTRNQWRFTGPDGDLSVRVSGPLKVNNGEALRKAVLRGLGIAVLGNYQIRDDIRSGAVKVLFPDYFSPSLDVQIVYPPTRHVPMRARVFIDFFRKRIRSKLAALDDEAVSAAEHRPA